jgi:hypothetical protein
MQQQTMSLRCQIKGGYVHQATDNTQEKKNCYTNVKIPVQLHKRKATNVILVTNNFNTGIAVVYCLNHPNNTMIMKQF